MSSIRSSIRSKNRVLEQVFNRNWENLLYNPDKFNIKSKEKFHVEVNDRDCFFRITRNDAVVEVLDIKDDVLTVRGIDIIGDLFTKPKPSSAEGIFRCNNSERELTINISELSCNLYKMPYGGEDEFVLVPLLQEKEEGTDNEEGE